MKNFFSFLFLLISLYSFGQPKKRSYRVDGGGNDSSYTVKGTDSIISKRSINAIDSAYFDGHRLHLILGGKDYIFVPADSVLVSGVVLTPTIANYQLNGVAYTNADGKKVYSPLSQIEVETASDSVYVTAYSNYTGYRSMALFINGVFNQTLPLYNLGENVVPLVLPAGTKNLRFVSGTQNRPNDAGDIQYSQVTGLRFQKGRTAAFLPWVKKNKRAVFLTNSMGVGYGLDEPQRYGYLALLRAAHPDYDFTNIGYGGKRADYSFGTTAAIDSILVQMHRVLDSGNSDSLKVVIELGLNDYLNNGYNAEDLATHTAIFIDRAHTDFPSAIVLLQTISTTSAEDPTSAGAYRSAITSLVNGREGWVKIIDGSVLSSVDNTLDGIHWNIAGNQDVFHVLDTALFSLPPAAGGGGNYDIDALTLFTAIGTNGSVSDKEKQAYSDLVAGLKADATWSSFARVFPLLGNAATSQQFDGKAPGNSSHNATFHGGVTFMAGGVDFDGSTGYANTHFSNASLGADRHMSFYVAEGTTSGWNAGAFNGSVGIGYKVFDGQNASSGVLFDSGVIDISGDGAAGPGYYLINIKDGTGTVYKNGAVVHSAPAGTFTDNLELYFGALNITGAAQQHTNGAIKFFTTGAGLTSTQVNQLNSRFQSFKSAASK